MMKQDFLQVRINEDEKAELNEMVEKLKANQDTDVSKFVRDAVREKMTRVRRKFARESVAASA